MFRSKRALLPFEKGTWQILSGYTLSLFGTGMTEPYLILYLHQLRDIPLSLSGMIVGSGGLAGVIAVPLSGILADRAGIKRVFLCTLILDAAGRILFAFASNEETAFLASMLSGAGAAGSWNTLSVILADSAGDTAKSSIFGIAFALQNLGSGLGAALGGTVIHSYSLFSFQSIFIFDAATFILFALSGQKWLMNDFKNVQVHHSEKQIHHFFGLDKAGNDKVLSGLSLVYSLIAIVMSGLTTTAFPQWTTDQAHASVHIIGDAFFVNSLVIILGQAFILKSIKNVRRTRAIAAAALFFAVGCFIIFISGFLKPKLSSLSLVSSFAITAVGETVLFSDLPALANDLALEQTRGRYNGVINAAWQTGSILGPVLAGAGLSMHLAVPLFLTFILILVFSACFLILLERIIPIEINKACKTD